MKPEKEANSKRKIGNASNANDDEDETQYFGDVDQEGGGLAEQNTERLEPDAPEPALPYRTNVKADPDTASTDAGTRSGEGASATGTTNPYITLEVRSVQGREMCIQFKLKRTATFKKLFAQFCIRFGLDPAQIRFLYDGIRVNTNSTPQQLDMEENDVIEANVMQDGGAHCESLYF